MIRKVTVMREPHPFLSFWKQIRFQKQQLRTKWLRVVAKIFVPAGSITEPMEWHIGRDTKLKTFHGTYPNTDKYVLIVSLRVGRWRSEMFTVAVDRELYLQVAPGDIIANPHLGGYNKEAHVDPRVGIVPLRPQEHQVECP